MKMDSNALKFDTGVMQLAMPTESAFTKGAEGISNVGKVFIEADKRKEESKLNALKMEEANQTIIGKKFENDTAQEKFDTTMSGLVADKRSKVATAIKTENENKAELKKLEDNGVLEKLGSVLPTTDFYQDGKIDIKKFDATRTAFLADPKWAGKEYVVNAMFDKKLSEMTKLQEDLFKNNKTGAEVNKIKEETAIIKPESIAKIAKDNSATQQNIEETKYIGPKANAYVNKQNSGANLDNVNAGLAPVKVQIAKDTEHRLNGTGPNSKTDTKSVAGRQALVAANKMENLVPDENFGNMDPKQKLEIQKVFINNGTLPKYINEKDGVYKAVYEKGELKPTGLPVKPTPVPLPVLPTNPIESKVIPKAKTGVVDHGSEVKRLLAK